MTNPRLIYVDGVMVPYPDATIHVSSVAAKYGANVFEGLCAYAGDGELGLRIQERDIDRSELYVADEAFFCGSALELRPILSVDRFPVGDGRIGPVTRQLWNAYEAVVRGRNPARAEWLTPVEQTAKRRRRGRSKSTIAHGRQPPFRELVDVRSRYRDALDQ